MVAPNAIFTAAEDTLPASIGISMQDGCAAFTQMRHVASRALAGLKQAEQLPRILQLRVDRNNVRELEIFPSVEINSDGHRVLVAGFPLPKDLVSEMSKGTKIRFAYTPGTNQTHYLRFSLLGFTAAHKWLSAQCSRTADIASPASSVGKNPAVHDDANFFK